MPNSKRIFIVADHGLSIVYFLQSDLAQTLLDAGHEVILLTDDGLVDQIQSRFRQDRLTIEGLRLKQAQQYFQGVRTSAQWWTDFLRRAGASSKINLQAVDSYVNQIKAEAKARRKILFPIMQGAVLALRHSKIARKILVASQARFNPQLYRDLFDRYQPSLVIASTPGWRHDRYILREASARGIPTAAGIVGWDNSSSYSLPGAQVDWITCWSEIQKEELVRGSDWHPERVNIGGIPSYDGYFRKTWLVSRLEYYHLHQLDPDRKLLAYASSFISFSPNIQNIQALAELVESDQLSKPCQLLVRLHPNHFMDVPRFIAERQQIEELAASKPYVHVVQPVPLGGQLGYYSGEDMPEKASMMEYADVFLTVYSTMVVEASIHTRPVVSVCIDSETGWPGKYTLPLSKIGGWPTHLRFRESGAGIEALDKKSLAEAINYYLENPDSGRQKREQFIQRECTYTDGSAGRRTAEFFLSLLDRDKGTTT